MRLIEVLNKIANGELKEGTKVIWDFETYRYDGHNRLWRFVCDYTRELWDDISLCNLNDKCELIEVEQIDGEKVIDEFIKGKTICEHEWEEYVNYNGNTKTYTRKCIKCDLDEEIEPTDNTTEKIEELECGDKYGGITARIINKLNEVIRKLNKEDNNE